MLILDRLDALLVSAALLTTGLAGGIVLQNVADGGNGVVTVTAPPSTVTVTRPPRTLPPKTVEVTRTVRVSRGDVRETPPTRIQRNTAVTGEYQRYARSLVSASQWPCLRTLWQRESGWNPDARTGSHYGIAQRRGEMNTDYRRQIVLGLSYIDSRYGGSACAALAHSDQNGWY